MGAPMWSRCLNDTDKSERSSATFAFQMKFDKELNETWYCRCPTYFDKRHLHSSVKKRQMMLDTRSTTRNRRQH